MTYQTWYGMIKKSSSRVKGFCDQLIKEVKSTAAFRLVFLLRELVLAVLGIPSSRQRTGRASAGQASPFCVAPLRERGERSRTLSGGALHGHQSHNQPAEAACLVVYSPRTRNINKLAEEAIRRHNRNTKQKATGQTWRNGGSIRAIWSWNSK